jgi:hypothetical protein
VLLLYYLIGVRSVAHCLLYSQCTKRSLKCKYPTESHRGIRKNKRKKEVDLELNAEIMAAAGLNESHDADADAEGEDEF